MERSSFADYRGNLSCRLGQHVYFVFAEDPCLDCLYHQYALQNTAFNQRHTQERLVRFFASLFEVLKPGMGLDLAHGDRTNLLCDQTRQAFVHGHPEVPDTLAAKSDRGGQYEICTVRLKQIGGTNICPEP